jgi:vanillate O-demethylase oxygenase-like protein
MRLKENVLDLTHFGFVHPATFQIKGWIKPPVTGLVPVMLGRCGSTDRTGRPPAGW